MPEEPITSTPPRTRDGLPASPAGQSVSDSPAGGEQVSEPVTSTRQDALAFQPADPSWAPPQWEHTVAYGNSPPLSWEAIDPSAATGPPWPRLVATGGDYSPPRLLIWPIVLGALLLIWQIAGAVIERVHTASTNPSSAPPYVLTATDAHFTATFPGQPTRTDQSQGSVTVIVYLSTLSDHAVGVTYVPLSAPGAFNLGDAIDGGAQGAGGTVVSHTTLTYRGQPAEDAVISVAGGTLSLRAVAFGSAGYILEGAGASVSNFSKDYDTLLATFTSTSPTG